MKKRLIIIFTILSIIILLTVTAVISTDRYSDTDFNELFSFAKKAKNEQKTVVAIVEGKVIYQETVDFFAIGEKIANSSSPDSISLQTNDEVDKSEILQKQIRNAVVLAEAERLGLTVSLKEAEKYTKENFELVKKENGQNWQFLLKYMEELDLSEKEYLRLASEAQRNTLTRAKLYEKFTEGKSGTYEELVTEYEKYVDELINKADIQYKN